MNDDSDISLIINGASYSGWDSVNITLSMETLSGAFNLGLTDNIPDSSSPVAAQSPAIIPGLPASIQIVGKTVITGWIDKVSPIIDRDTHAIVAQGRDVTGDLNDCSMILATSQWIGLTIDKIISAICAPFNIPVTINGSPGTPITFFVVEQGSSCFEVIQKLCYMRQLLAISNGQGGLLLTQASTQQSTTALIEGQNIEYGSADYDLSQRYQTYIVKGQRQGVDLSAPVTNTGNSGSYTDDMVTRYRPLMIIADGQASVDDCKQRAAWEGAIRRGKSRKFTITVNGWTQGDGSLWQINQLVPLQSPLLGVNDILLVSQVEFKLDGQGQITVLTLTSPEAYTLNSSKLIKSAALLKSNPYISG